MKKYGLIFISILFIFTLFAQKTLNIYKADLSVLNLIVSSIDSIQFSTNQTVLDIHNPDNSVTSVPVSTIDSLTFTDGVSPALPVIVTSAVSAVSYTTAQTGFTIQSIGGTTILEKGICWSTTENPGLTDNKVISASSSNSSSVSLTGLTPGSVIYIRAYATNLTKTSFGEQISFTTSSYSLALVETVSAVYNYSTNKVTCVGNVKNNGGCGSIIERGVCWSTTKTPTIADSKYASGASVGQYYAMMSNLSLNSTYYVRAYATNCAGTAYGAALSVKPLMGNVTYTLDIDSAANPVPYRMIKIAMDSACVYYNRYTPFRCNIYVYYNAGIPTAQASYHGSIGFGPNTRYMWVGTAIHEMAHFMGSGTTTAWQAKVVGGVWTGTTASALLKTLTGETLKGDSQHFWPYGINQKEEITGLGAAAAQANGLATATKLVKAMVIDDARLPTSW